jgi:hypothetical protein
VYLRTLGGLKPVDVILRRLDDAFSDPLELRGDSLLGVPGLVEAVRNGSVIIDNALGSGLVETAANMAFLPGLCRQLLGEELRMPSVATWWCGQDEPRRYVRDHLKDLVIKPAFPRFGQHPEFPETMSDAMYEALVKRIEAQPEEFVAQERVALSTVPVRTEAGIAPRHMVLRIYAAWNGQSYTVLPGGLTRVSTQDSSLVVSMHLGGGSKDTWVLSDTAEAVPARRQASVWIPEHRAGDDLPSRVADNLFWLGRYAERVEERVRLVRALWPALSSEEDFGRAVSLETCHSRAGRTRISGSGNVCYVARRAAMDRSTDSDGNGVRPFADVEPAMESKRAPARRLAFERTAVFRYVACAPAARIAVFRICSSKCGSALFWWIRSAGQCRSSPSRPFRVC